MNVSPDMSFSSCELLLNVFLFEARGSKTNCHLFEDDSVRLLLAGRHSKKEYVGDGGQRDKEWLPHLHTISSYI